MAADAAPDATPFFSLGYLAETPSQTAGPYVHIGLIPRQAGFDIFENNLGTEPMAGPGAKGERVRIEGRIFDGAGGLVRDALVEAWQADANGRHPHPADTQGGAPPDPAFRNWGRTGTDFETGLWSFDTVKPGPRSRPPRLPQDGAAREPLDRGARHQPRPLDAALLRGRGRGQRRGPRAQHGRPAGAALHPAGAARHGPARPGGAAAYVFDIRLQGPDETVFFDA
jgi:protocatechuate 3,4-dioxygenase, alpha subunit